MMRVTVDAVRWGCPCESLTALALWIVAVPSRHCVPTALSLDRRQLLRAIADLKDGGAPKPAVTTSFPVAPQPHDAAERRHVTVMFSDLVNSTGITWVNNRCAVVPERPA